MTTKSILTAALIGFGLITQAQWVNPNRLKTGKNGTGIISPVNTAIDLAWDVSVTSINTGYTDAIRVFQPGWMTSPYADVTWIAYPHGCNAGNQSESWCPSGANLDEYFKVTFDIGSCGLYCLNYTAWADNCIYKMYLNNTTTPFYTTGSPSPYTHYGFRIQDSISGQICSGFVPGTNTLYVHVKSGHNPTTGNTGFLFRGMPSHSCSFLSYGGGGDPDGKQGHAEQQQQIDDLKSLLEVMTGGTAKPSVTQVMLSDKNTIVLDQNVPNPFAENTVISYNIPRSFNKAQILFFSYDGKIIKTIDINEPGRNSLNVFANDLSKGMYSYKLVVDGETVDAKKMIKD